MKQARSIYQHWPKCRLLLRQWQRQSLWLL